MLQPFGCPRGRGRDVEGQSGNIAGRGLGVLVLDVRQDDDQEPILRVEREVRGEPTDAAGVVVQGVAEVSRDLPA